MFGLPPNADISSHFTAGVSTNGNWRSCAALSLARLAIPSRRRLKSGDELIAAELSLMVAFQMVRLFGSFWILQSDCFSHRRSDILQLHPDPTSRDMALVFQLLNNEFDGFRRNESWPGHDGHRGRKWRKKALTKANGGSVV